MFDVHTYGLMTYVDIYVLTLYVTTWMNEVFYARFPPWINRYRSVSLLDLSAGHLPLHCCRMTCRTTPPPQTLVQKKPVYGPVRIHASNVGNMHCLSMTIYVIVGQLYVRIAYRPEVVDCCHSTLPYRETVLSAHDQRKYTTTAQ
jgi:hypothetical protein